MNATTTGVDRKVPSAVTANDAPAPSPVASPSPAGASRLGTSPDSADDSVSFPTREDAGPAPARRNSRLPEDSRSPASAHGLPAPVHGCEPHPPRESPAGVPHRCQPA